MTAIALTIAGSDSGGGAGIQADLKTFSALNVYGCSVITALTAQNTREVAGIFDVDPGFIRAQMDTVFADLTIDAVKIGMLGKSEVIEAVAVGLAHWRPTNIILDPVMVAKSGDKLLQDDAIQALKETLLPMATLITPNLPEAMVLLRENREPTTRHEMKNLAAKLQALSPASILLKGGHLRADESPDLFLCGDEHIWFDSPRIRSTNTHGTGCTLSSAIAACCARGMPLSKAIIEAKSYISAAIQAADELHVGSGHGPVHHFYRFWQS